MATSRVAVVVSHPIQHFCPQYSSWGRLPGVDVKVFFASNHGLMPYEDKRFNRVVQWDNIRLDFDHEFLPGADQKALGRGIDSDALAERLTAFGPHALVIYGYTQALQRRALSWAGSAHVPVLMVADSELRTPRNAIKRAVKALVLPKLLNAVKLFLTVGDANEAYYRNYGVSDARLVRCFFPIDIQRYDAVLDKRDEYRASLRAELGIPEHHKVLLKVGKFVPWKRQSDLIRFSNEMAGRRSDVTVILAGTGPDEDALRRLARQTGVGGTLFAGFVAPDKLAEYYCAADVYVHCSEHEPHSLAISEAIYSALPVILSDRCGSYGPSDDVQPGRNGFVYACGDVADLTRHVLPVITNPELRRRMSSASRQLGDAHQQLAHGAALTQALTLLGLERLTVS